VLDPECYFIVIPNQFGNGLSTVPAFGLGRNPVFTHSDSVHAQERLLREKFDVTRLVLVYGWSMGGQQALHWGAALPGPDTRSRPDSFATRIRHEHELALNHVDELILLRMRVTGQRLAAGQNPREIDAVVLEPSSSFWIYTAISPTAWSPTAT
jgi:homoserine acetyltransferase